MQQLPHPLFNKGVLASFVLASLTLLSGCRLDKDTVSEVKSAASAANDAVKQAIPNNTTNNPYKNLPTSTKTPSYSPSANTATMTAAPATCDSVFFHGKKPQLAANLTSNGQFLCFHDFAVFYSGSTKTPLWSAEYLTKDRLLQSAKLNRVDNFHEEPRLTVMPAHLSDYSGTGYDRGHLSPNADMKDRESQFDSFSLANIAPQDPELNRGEWANLEKRVRGFAYKTGDAYVVTGVLFKSPTVKSLNGVLVPSHFYKAVYIPSTNESMVFVAENVPNATINTMPMTQFQSWAGVSVF